MLDRPRGVPDVLDQVSEDWGGDRAIGVEDQPADVRSLLRAVIRELERLQLASPRPSAQRRSYVCDLEDVAQLRSIILLQNRREQAVLAASPVATSGNEHGQATTGTPTTPLEAIALRQQVRPPSRSSHLATP
jgi:hypothetical protein